MTTYTRRRVRYAVLVEKGTSSWGAYVPDLPGCIAAAETEEEVKALICEAVEFHLEGLHLDGDPIPEPTSDVYYVEVTHPDPGGPPAPPQPD